LPGQLPGLSREHRRKKKKLKREWNRLEQQIWYEEGKAWGAAEGSRKGGWPQG
jgi:hypothetical protein